MRRILRTEQFRILRLHVCYQKTLRLKYIKIYFYFYGCKTWPIASKEEDSFTLPRNRLLSRIYGPKRDKVMGGWKKSRN